MSKSFIFYPLTHGLLADLREDEYPSQLWGYDDKPLHLTDNGTHFGYVFEGQYVVLDTKTRGFFLLKPGMFFSLPEPGVIWGDGKGIVVTRLGYEGVFTIGGPVEQNGRLLYIDGCRDTLLISPVMRGDPCLNALYFPAGIDQTPHIHPSLRVGVVISGRGECVTPDEVIPLEPGQAFVIPAGSLHSFKTTDNSLVVVAYHPDSNYGPTHENHPMINRTWVNGVSASQLQEIRTRG